MGRTAVFGDEGCVQKTEKSDGEVQLKDQEGDGRIHTHTHIYIREIDW
jgi:hypothetical protein